jgi:hypothetical protein
VENALCLCSLHHKLLDAGVLGLSEDHRVLVSMYFVARSDAGQRMVLELAGQDCSSRNWGSPGSWSNTSGGTPRRCSRRPHGQPEVVVFGRAQVRHRDLTDAGLIDVAAPPHAAHGTSNGLLPGGCGRRCRCQ